MSLARQLPALRARVSHPYSRGRISRLKLQPFKVVVLLNGRYAGRKAVIVKSYDEGTSSRPYGHALVCGIANYPKKVRSAPFRARFGVGEGAVRPGAQAEA